MDENLQAKIDEAKAAGYSDQEIQAYLNPPAETPAPNVSTGNAPVSPYVDRSAEKTALGEYGATKLAEYGLGGYGVYKAGQGIARAFGGGAPAPGPVAPPAPPASAAPLEAGGQAVKDFVQQQGKFTPPQGTPPAPPVTPQPTTPSPYQRGIDAGKVVRQIALEKIAPALSTAAPYARAATGIGALVMPGNVGQNYPFPTSGPMRGMEINPQTGRPWTQQELAAYRAQYGQ